MSGAADDSDDAAELAQKVEQYAYLLPGASAAMIAKMNSGAPPGPPGEAPEPDPRLLELAAPDWPAPDPAAARDRAVGSFLGLAIGDAIGGAVEFKPRDSFPPVTEMTGGGAFHLAPGEWTDDTTMALCLAESLLEADTVDQDELMTRLRGWLERGENTVRGSCFDIGATTRAAIAEFAATGQAAAGSEEPTAAGNGSLVRLAPLAIFAAGRPDEAAFLAQKQSRATHGAQECLDACTLFVAQLLDALSGADKAGALRPRVMSLSPRLLFINAGEWKDKPRARIRSSGYVVHTLEAALWSVWQTGNFRDAVLLAANLGDDADSVAAVAGQLAGALYGAQAIPAAWRARVAWGDRIAMLANALFDRNVGR